MLLKTESIIKDNKLFVSLIGVLDISTIELFTNSLDNVQNVQEVNLDFDELNFIDSTGIGSLTEVINNFRENKVDIKIKNVSRDIFDVLNILGLIEIIGTDVFEIKKD